MEPMNKAFYRRCLNEEVYNGARGLQKLRVRAMPSREAVWLIRTMQYYAATKAGKFLSRHYNNLLVKRYGIFVHPENAIGIGLKLPHPNGIIVGAAVSLGNNCIIYQQVTLGSARKDDYKLNLQPAVGDNVTLFAGCKVLGAITVAQGTVVGANAVLTKSTEENSVYAGVPAVRLK